MAAVGALYALKMFNAHGYLEPGFHKWTVAELKTKLVDSFPHSTTRANIYAGFSRLRHEISSLIQGGEQIIDGSYCTEKVDPNDIDAVTFLDLETINALSHPDQSALADLFAGPNSKGSFSTDSYFVWSVPITHPAYQEYLASRRYWMGQFGFDRLENPKGMLLIQL